MSLAQVQRAIDTLGAVFLAALSLVTAASFAFDAL